MCRIRGEFVASKPAIDILLNDGDEQPDLQMTSHKPGKEFTIIETQTKRVICECRRQPWYDAGSKTASGQEHRHSVSGSDKYFLRIHPGVDAALMTLVCLMLDLIYKDEEKPLV